MVSVAAGRVRRNTEQKWAAAPEVAIPSVSKSERRRCAAAVEKVFLLRDCSATQRESDRKIIDDDDGE